MSQSKLGTSSAICMKMIELELRVKDFIQQHKLISPGEIVVVAVSGGADSVCLLHMLARWQSELDIKLHIAHLNHQLRGAESEADAKYVFDLAAHLAVPITVGKRDVAAYKAERACSTEEAARELRYDFLAKVAADIGANRVAIGHTRDDQVETILMHILRGTGTSGLRGLEPCSPVPSKSGQPSAVSYQVWAIRPLLGVTREETTNYCQAYQLAPRIDSSNLSLSFFRNRLRLELLPLLREYNSNVDQALLRLAEIANDDTTFIQQQALQSWEEVVKLEDGVIYLDKKKTIALPLALQRQLIRLALARILGNTRDIEASHIEAVRGLLNKPVGKRVSLPHNIICQGGYNEVVIALSQSSEPKLRAEGVAISEGEAWQSHPVVAGFIPALLKNLIQGKFGEEQTKPAYVPCQPLLRGRFRLNIPGETILPGWRVIASISPVIVSLSLLSLRGLSRAKRGNSTKQSQSGLMAEFDLQPAGNELFVRQRQPGDSFQPLGMNKPKKLQRFMVDAKIPLSWRDHIPLVCSLRQILWVVGWRIDDRVKVTETSREILRLEFARLL